MASKWLIHTSCTSGASSGRTQRRRGAPQLGPAVLATHPSAHGAAELLGDQLGAVADAEHGDAELVDRRVERRGPLDVDALGSARQDQRGRPPLGHLGGRDAVGHDLGVDGQLADAAGDQLGVLGAEVDDEHGDARASAWGIGGFKASIVDSAGRNLLDVARPLLAVLAVIAVVALSVVGSDVATAAAPLRPRRRRRPTIAPTTSSSRAATSTTASARCRSRTAAARGAAGGARLLSSACSSSAIAFIGWRIVRSARRSRPERTTTHDA